MTVSMRVMSAGDGFRYLLRTVAAGDGDRRVSTPLTRYYAEKGTPPGFWLGSGVASLAGGAIRAGDQVTEAQLELLIGMGRDPVTGEPLGRAYQEFAGVAERVSDRSAQLPPGLSPQARSSAVAVIEGQERERGTRRAVAGYDFTFSVPKSVSVLWGVADAGTQALIAQAHHAAIAEVLDFLEREVAVTRVGATGPDGAVAHLDVTGVVAAGFDHYDSRSGDPQLHTHVVISNKVMTAADGRWRTLAGRPMHAAVVALSEHYNAVLADGLARVLGLGWEERSRGRDRNPAWEIVVVTPELVSEFSSRSRFIEVEKERLIAEYVAAHGRQPSARTVIRLRAQATLSTRPEKQQRSLAELTAGWRQRATALLGQDATGWAQKLLADSMPAAALHAAEVLPDVVAELGRRVVEAVGEKRSTWRRWNLHAEASRQTMGWRFASTEDREAVVGLIADAAESASLRLTPTELASSPTVFTRPDDTSRFRPKHAIAYSSETLLDAEDRLLEHARATTGPTITLASVRKSTRRRGQDGRMLGPDQAAALARIATSGRVVDVLVGPAGTGKTTAMRALRRAWEREHGTGSVIGLAPSAAAAHVLGEDLGITAENTAMWWQTHLSAGATFHPGQLVILDEASLAGTLSLDRITTLAADVGAKALLVGDNAQLQSVDAGGAFALLLGDRNDAPELVGVHRFAHEWEKAATLRLRHGHTAVIDTYLEHDRVRDGDTEEVIDAAYTAWRADVRAGRATVLVTDSNESVAALNIRARTDLIIDGTVEALTEVTLHDGAAAGVGDTIITRRNDRNLRTGRSWVRNGDRWKVTRVHADGALTVRAAGRRRASVVLPADFVAEAVELGYAVTSYRAQGVTTDTAHVLVDAAMTRENLYVAMTRGRQANLAYVATDKPDIAHGLAHSVDRKEATGRSVLYGVLQHVGAELSAHETITAEQNLWGSIAQLAAEYDTIATAAQHDRWVDLVTSAGLSDEQAEQVIGSDAFGALCAELRRAEATHHDVAALLPRLVASRDLTDAEDVAAILHHRLAAVTARPSGAGRNRQAPRLIAGLMPEARGPLPADMRQALDERRDLINQRAHALVEQALATPGSWITTLGTPPKPRHQAERWQRLAATVAAYRDRYAITGTAALGGPPESDAQRIDARRARAALEGARTLAAANDARPGRSSAREAATLSL